MITLVIAINLTHILIWFGEEGVWKEGGEDYPLTFDGECKFKFLQKVDVLVLYSLRYTQLGEKGVDFSQAYSMTTEK